MRKRAIEYLNKQWSVFPIKVRTKIPAISSWKEYQTRLPTTDEINDWWDKFPDANIAVVCGEISGIIVVDIDSGKGNPDTKDLELPPTLTANTGGGGQHLFYKWRKGLTHAQAGIRNFVDIRSDNSIIVLPPSIHATGNRYTWANDLPIAPAPIWLEEETPMEKTNWKEKLSETNDKGQRNENTTSIIGKYLYEVSPEHWDDIGWEMAKAYNNTKNIPPLPEKELQVIYDSVKRLHLRNNKTPPSINIPGDDLTNEEEESEIRKLFVKHKIEGTYALAKYIVKKFDIITIGEKEREIYLYKNGQYIRGESDFIFPEIQRVLGEKVNKSAKMETLHKIHDDTAKPRDIFSSTDLRYIPLKNGVYDTVAMLLLPHDPKYRFTFQFPVDYVSGVEPMKTIAFFEEVLNSEHIPMMQEWLGYYFLRNYSFKKALIMVGEGDTGKTTLLETISYLLGLENISAISLQKMSGDKFSAAHLYGKHGNIVDELSAKDINDTGGFKMATGNGMITGEYKFGNQFNFHNYSKFTFACNKIPDVSAFDDDAYFNRWLVIRFEKKIKNKIPNFALTLTTDLERSGMFNYAMKGLRRLLEQGQFTYGKNAIETKMDMLRGGSSVAMFAADMLEQEKGGQVTKQDMYEAYIKFCEEREFSAETIKMVGSKLPYFCHYISEGITQVPKTTKVWRNVRIKSIEPEAVPDPIDWVDFEDKKDE